MSVEQKAHTNSLLGLDLDVFASYLDHHPIRSVFERIEKELEATRDSDSSTTSTIERGPKFLFLDPISMDTGLGH